MRNVVGLSLLLLAGIGQHELYAQQDASVVEHGVYEVHLLLHGIGTEEYSISDDGTHRQMAVTTSTNDRGMKHLVSTTLDFGEGGAAVRLEQHALAVPGSPPPNPGSLTEIQGSAVTVREGKLSRLVTKPAIAFPGLGSMPASLQMMMMRYWLQHGRPAQLALLRASPDAKPVEIRMVGHEAFTVRHKVIRLTRYTITNLIFGREVLWMNDSNRVAALMTFAGGLPQEEVLDEYASALDGIYQSGVRQEMIDLGELSHSMQPEAGGSFALVGARLIDATGAPAVENSVVIVRNGRIAAVGAAGSVVVPAHLRVIHGEGKSLLPGLWDMHVHYSGVEFGPAMLAAGITTARDCGGEFDFLTQVRKAIDTQHMLGPRLLLAGLIDSGGPLAFGAFDIETPEQAIEAVDLYADSHFDQIKVYTQIKPEILRVITAEAHRRGLTVTGHVPQADDAFEGIADGMDMINHLEFVTDSMLPKGSKETFTPAALESERGRALIRLLVERHVVVDPTLAWGEMAGHPKSIETASFEPGVDAAPFPLATRFRNIGSTTVDAAAFNAEMAANEKAVDTLFTAGVPIVAGSDTDLVGYGLDRELELYVQAGMTPLQAIQSATIVPARVMKRDGDSGTIEAGKRADLVLVDGNPLNNISDLRRVVSVVVDGRLFDSRKLARSVGFSR